MKATFISDSLHFLVGFYEKLLYFVIIVIHKGSNNPYPEPSTCIIVILCFMIVFRNESDVNFQFSTISTRILFPAIIIKLPTPWLMEPGGSMPHSQGPSNIPYPEPN